MTSPAATIAQVRYRLMDIDDMNPLLDDTTTLEAAIRAAIAHYSKDQPREVTADVTGTGSAYYPLTGAGKVLTAWATDFSTIRTIDYPASAVSASYVPTFLDDGEYTMYSDASATYLVFLGANPSATEKARVTYTAPHTHTTTTDTVPTTDLPALYDLAAHYGCVMLATKMAAASDATLMADGTNYRDAQLRFKQQADAWLALYKTKLGISSKADAVAPAAGYADWNRKSTTGWPFLTHNRRWG